MKLFRKYKDILFLLFLSILVPMLWYGLDPNTLITSHDVGSSLNPVEFVKTRFFAWHSGVNLGRSQTELVGAILYYGSEALSTYLSGSVFIGQKIIVILWFILPMLAIYIFIKRIPAFANKPYMALLAAILFQFNHYQQHGWRVFWRTRFSAYILLPLILLLLINYLEGRSKLGKTAVYVGLFVFLFNGGGSPPIFGSVILLVLVTSLYYLLINLRHQFLVYLKRSALFILTVGVISFLTSSFWIFPYLYQTVSSYSQAIQLMGGLEASIGWTDVVSLETSILNLLRNVGILFWNTSFEDPHLFLTNPLLIIISFIWPILTFSSIFLIKNKEEKKYILLFLLLTLTALVYTAGTHKPFREFYIFHLTHIPGYVIFRSPLYKFGNLLWFSYAALIAFSISTIMVKIKDFLIVKGHFSKRTEFLLPAVFMLLIFIWDYPVFNSRFFTFIRNPPLTTMEKVPSYVFDYKKWMDKQKDFSTRTLLLPELNKDWRSEIYRWGYSSFGSQLFPLLTSKNTIANDTSVIVIDGLYESLKKNNPTWLNLATGLNIRYLLLRNDYLYNTDWAPTTSPDKFDKILRQSNDLDKVKTFGEWDLYQVKTDIPVEKIRLETQPLLYQAQDDDVLQLFSLISQKHQGPNDNILFVSTDDLPNDPVNNKSIIVVPQPIDIFSPIEKEKFVLPKPKLLPNSPLYFLTEGSENRLLKTASKPEEISDIYIKLSINRLAELNELLTIGADLNEIEKVSDRHFLLLNDIDSILNKLLKSKKDVNRAIVHTKGFLMEERKLIEKWMGESEQPWFKKILKKNYNYLNDIIDRIPTSKEQEAVLNWAIKNYDDPDTVFLTEGYKWIIPQSGLYQVYLNNESLLSNSDGFEIHIDDKTVEVKIDRDKKDSNWQKIAEVNLDKGEHGLEIIVEGKILSSFKKGDIIFIKNNSEVDKQITSNISYRRINPTKYIARITFNSPLILVLDEEFNLGWKIYFKEKFSSDKSSPSFADQVRKFLDEYLFNTLFLKPLPEEQHLKVNGYANAWYIKQSPDIKGEEFEVVIEYWPQRVFYLGFLVAIVAISASIGYLFISRQKH